MSATTDIDPDTHAEALAMHEAYNLMCTSVYGHLRPGDFARLDELKALGVEIPDPPARRLA
jgi:hypothetical protein